MLSGLSFASAPGSLKAKVLDVDGKPVTGAKIFLYEGVNVRKPADFISPPSDQEGRVVVSLPPGKYRAVARIKQGPLFGPLTSGDRHSGEPTEVEVESGAEAGADFVVADIREIGQKRRSAVGETVRLHGRILDAAGKPVANAYAFASMAKEISDVPAFMSAWTDEDGRYELYLPKTGKFFLGANKQFPLPAGVAATVEIGSRPGKSDVAMDLAVTVY